MVMISRFIPINMHNQLYSLRLTILTSTTESPFIPHGFIVFFLNTTTLCYKHNIYYMDPLQDMNQGSPSDNPGNYTISLRSTGFHFHILDI